MSLAEEALSIVRSTRALSFPQWGKAEAVEKKGSDAGSVVTELDRSIEKYLETELHKLDPDALFVGEEFGGDRSAEKFWLCDPIDGTGLYIRGMLGCTTMLARVEAGQVVFSAVYDFVNDVMYHAELGQGAFANGLPMRVSDRSLDDAYITWETHINKPENLSLYLKLSARVIGLKMMNAGYRAALVASGKLEACICFDPHGKDFDFAPGALLISEAGGVVANIGANSYDYRNLDFIAANPNVYRALTSGPDAIFPV